MMLSSKLMNRFKSLRVLGDGSFGTVLLAENISTSEMVSVHSVTPGCYQEDEAKVQDMG
jgi:serine/threonine protein kinase